MDHVVSSFHFHRTSSVEALLFRSLSSQPRCPRRPASPGPASECGQVANPVGYGGRDGRAKRQHRVPCQSTPPKGRSNSYRSVSVSHAAWQANQTELHKPFFCKCLRCAIHGKFMCSRLAPPPGVANGDGRQRTPGVSNRSKSAHLVCPDGWLTEKRGQAGHRTTPRCCSGGEPGRPNTVSGGASPRGRCQLSPVQKVLLNPPQLLRDSPSSGCSRAESLAGLRHVPTRAAGFVLEARSRPRFVVKTSGAQVADRSGKHAIELPKCAR